MRARFFWHIVGILALSFGISTLGCRRSGSLAPPTAPLRVNVSRPVQRQITEYSEFTSQTAAIDSVQVRARVSGYLEKVNFKEGAMVKVDDVLYVIDRRTFQAQFNQAKAKLDLDQANLKLSESNYKRIQSVAEKGASTPQEVEQSLAARDVAAAQVLADKADLELRRLNLDFCEVKSPIAGRIGRTLVTIGNLVQAGGDTGGGTVLTTIVSVDPVWAYFDVDEATVLRVRKLIREGKAKSAREGDVYVDLALANEQGYPHRGRIDFVDNQINTKTGTLRVRGVFPNKDDTLLPGLFARVRVPIGEPHETLLITDRAIDTDQAQKIVYVVGSDNRVVTRPIRLGPKIDNLRVIEDGLNPDDRVVVEGLQFVRPGITVEPKEVEMPEEKASAQNSK